MRVSPEVYRNGVLVFVDPEPSEWSVPSYPYGDRDDMDMIWKEQKNDDGKPSAGP